jgi:hypothetical protein
MKKRVTFWKTGCLKVNTIGNYIQAKKFTGVCRRKTKMADFILLCFLAKKKENKTQENKREV